MRPRTDPVVEAQSGNPLVSLDITGAGGIDDAFGKRGRRLGSGAVPAGLGTGQPVTDELLVETGLHLAGTVIGSRPVPRRIGGEDFVGQHQVAVGVDAELEFCVGDDDSLSERVVGGLDVGL